MKPKVILGDFTGVREPRLEELGWGRMKIVPFQKTISQMEFF